MENFKIEPTVNTTQEFIEIANDFSNPLELVREALSNAYDAKATKIEIYFDVVQEYGEAILKITLCDNGAGMTKEGVQSFFDLGNSLRKDDPDAIGEKGHGTKVYFNSQKICVTTVSKNTKFIATMDDPFKKLFDKTIPSVSVQVESSTEPPCTIIEIYGYNNNRRDRFTHEILKDYIAWFTKHGSFENIFTPEKFRNTALLLKGLGKDSPEEIKWGHFFPEESNNLNKLFEEHI